MKEIDRNAPVLVTGATGYVAGWLVKRLLDEGLTVHAAVRAPEREDKIAHLVALADAAPGTLRFFKADLLDDGAYQEAMQGCELVFHTASPFTSEFKDPVKELIEPAQLGTRNVLEEANRTPTVKRVVVTSSCAAIYGDNVDLLEKEGGCVTEADWNETSSTDHQPYFYSKTVAEKEAWSIAEKQDRWDLVTINPSLVIGPGTNAHGTSESFTIVRQFGDGTIKTGVPFLGLGAVDVRDVAEAHYQAGFRPEASGRYITSAHNTSLVAFAEALRPKYGDSYPLPKRVAPKWLIWLFGPMVNATLTRKVVSLNVGYEFKADNSKSVKELGLTYRPLEDSLNEMFEQMITEGPLAKPAE